MDFAELWSYQYGLTTEVVSESLSNIDGANLSRAPKIFKIIFNANKKLVEARIGNLICKDLLRIKNLFR